ncbi:MAG: 3-hydroxyacyl-CoA dehydrogenase [Pseudomonadota bacterium]
MDRKVISIIGCGMVGRSWALSFARGGYGVKIYDRDPSIAETAVLAVRQSAQELQELDLLDGQDVGAVCDRISIGKDLEHAVDGSDYIQENTPESVAVKVAVFKDLDRLASADTVIASSTSALLPSSFTQELDHAERCLVVHPLNPPHLIPAVELVPSPATNHATVSRAMAILKKAGQRPILVTREIEGFLMNRLQGAMLDEAFAMVAGGYASAEDVDAAVRDGLARRWSFMGPFETIDLNAPDGIADFIKRYGPAYTSIGKDRPLRHNWDGEVAELVIADRRRELPAERIRQRQQWRDRRLASLAAYARAAKDELGD